MKIGCLNNAAKWLAEFNLKEFREIIILFDFLEDFEKEKPQRWRVRQNHNLTILPETESKSIIRWGKDKWREYINKNIFEILGSLADILTHVDDIELRAIYVVYNDEKSKPIFFAHDLQPTYNKGNGWIIYNQLAAELTEAESEKIHEKSDIKEIFTKISDKRKIPVREPGEYKNYEKNFDFIMYPLWKTLMREYRVS